MTLYRAVLAPESPLASPLHSDTLFGAFCWAWVRRFGRESLEENLIFPSLAGSPPLIFSNVFPHEAFPLPLGCYDLDNRFETVLDKGERRKRYQEGKKLKSARYIAWDAFDRIRRGEWRGFTSELVQGAGETVTTLHNTVSRESGTVEKLEDSGSLFGLDRQYFTPSDRFDCYLLSNLSMDTLRDILTLTLTLGVGADKSTGCGVCRLESLIAVPELLLPLEGANAVLMLSNFLPAREDPTEGWYQTFPKYPKLDLELAAGEYPFKKPLLFLKAGSLFRTPSPKSWYGRCISNVAAVELTVIVNGCSIALPFRIPNDIVTEDR